MKHMKRIVAVGLVLVCLLSALPIASFALPEDRAGSGTKLIALTFDDGPGGDTMRLLNALRARGVHCTFFILGASASSKKNVVRQCYEDGNQIANHTYDHPLLTQKTDEQIRWQVNKTAEILDNAIGAHNTYVLRPPYGGYNQHILDIVNVPAFYWSDDPQDWKYKNANTVYNSLVSTAGDGDIMLLHDTHSWSVDAAIRVVDTLMARGYEFVTVSELFRRRGEVPKAGKIYTCQRPTGVNLPAISDPVIVAQSTEEGVLVSISADAGTEIHYTTDGSIPRSNSPVYTEPILFTSEATITAVAGYDMNGSRSNPAKLQFNVKPCAAPQISVTGEGQVTIFSSAQAYYTLDGSKPTSADGTAYQAPFTVAPDTLIRAMAFSGALGECASPTVYMYYTPNGNVFDDVLPGKWYTSAIDDAASAGLMVGTQKTHFDPFGTLSRAQLLSILYRLNGSPETESPPGFNDVPAGKWFSDAVAWGREAGIAAGYDDGLFHPNDPITKEQAASLLLRFTRLLDLEAENRAELDQFADEGSVSGYAREAVEWAVAAGILSGDGKGNLDPKGELTRAQTASIITRYAAAANTWPQVHLTDEELLSLANDVLKAISEKNFETLKTVIHPEKGLTFSPYPDAEATDQNFSGEELAQAAASDEILFWGYADGSGEDLDLTFEEYWSRFVWNADFTQADGIHINEIGRSGNAVENVTEVYEDCLFVQYDVDHVPAPEEPTEPVEPSDPTEPVEPVETTEPEESPEPASVPSDGAPVPSEPTDPDPETTSVLTLREEPAEPAPEEGEPVSPGEAEEPTIPGEGEEPTQPEAPETENFDWASLKLVFQRYEGKWYLVGIIHGQWTT